jgi:PPOX class probable F420-dependent enzyme
MDLAAAVTFASARKRGVLTTLRKDGRPQLSNILFVPVDGDFLISVTDDRAKTRNLRRDPRGALYVPGEDWWNYVVLDGAATLTEPAAAPDDAVVEQLVAYYRAGAGEHPDWDEFRATMVAERRLLVRFHPTGAAGMIQSA